MVSYAALGQTPEGLISYYPFSGNANDTSGGSNNGTVFGATLCADRNGSGNCAYSFDGSSNYITVGNSSSLQLGTNYTVACWFVVTGRSGSDWFGVVSKADTGNSGDAGPRISLYWPPASPRPYLNGDGVTIITTHIWYFVALSTTGSSLNWYLNGATWSVPMTQSWTFSNSFPVTIGGQNGSWASRVLHGSIDEVRIYNRALSNSELNTLYTNGVLPVQLASFMAQKYNANSMQLTWATVSEINNYGFYIQTSSNRTDWTNVGELIRGHGTTLESQKYSIILPIANGSWWVRLKQVDLDGTFTTSDARLIENASPVKFALNQNYPNPFNPSTQIAFSTTKEGPVSLRVYDILGREVATLVNENRKAGEYTERFDGSRFATGVYVYALQTAEGRLTSRMILSK